MHEVETAIDQLEEVVDINDIDVMTLDNGYCSGSNLTALEEADMDAYVSVGKENPKTNEETDPEAKFIKADFRYDAEADCFVCPAGEIIARDLDSKAKSNRYKSLKQPVKSVLIRSVAILIRQGNTVRFKQTTLKSIVRQ